MLIKNVLDALYIYKLFIYLQQLSRKRFNYIVKDGVFLKKHGLFAQHATLYDTKTPAST